MEENAVRKQRDHQLRKVQTSQKSALMPAVTWLALGTSLWPHTPWGARMQVLKKDSVDPGRRIGRTGCRLGARLCVGQEASPEPAPLAVGT